jgi:hypothetical protein
MAMFDAYEKRVMACLGQMEANEDKTVLDPEVMQSMEENQEDAVVKRAKGLKKWRRVQMLAPQRRQKPKEGTRGYCESRRRVTEINNETTSVH